MSTPKHTPGPWKVNQRFPGCCCVERLPGASVAWVSGLSSPSPERRITDEQAEANARLIAAAPTMLEALVDVASVLSERPLLEAPYSEQAVKYALGAARQAIALALAPPESLDGGADRAD